MDEVRTGNSQRTNMNPLPPQPAVVALDHALRIGLADRRGIGIHGVQQELKRGRALPRQIPRIVVRNHHSSVNARLADGIPKLVDGGVVARQAKALTLRHGRNQLTAFGRAAVIHHTKTNIGYRGTQRKPQEHELHDGREDQGDYHFAVMANLGELLLDQGAKAIIEQIFPKPRHRSGLNLHPSHAVPANSVE